jgi:hypothetical protein
MFARLALILTATILVSGESRTAEPPHDAIGILQDIPLRRAVENILSRDKELASYNLQADVKNQVAYLKGKVPNRELADLAVTRLQQAIPQLKSVKSELTLSGTIVLKLPATDASMGKPSDAKTGPIHIDSAPPLPSAPPRTQPKATPTSREILAERVAAIQKDSSFARVRVEIRGRVITVYRGTNAEAASVFAQRLRDLSGIEGVELLD